MAVVEVESQPAHPAKAMPASGAAMMARHRVCRCLLCAVAHGAAIPDAEDAWCCIEPEPEPAPATVSENVSTSYAPMSHGAGAGLAALIQRR